MTDLCIDLGATKTLFGLLDDEFEVLEQIKTDDFLEDMHGTVKGLVEVDSLDNIAVGAAGPLDDGVIRPPNREEDKIDVVGALGGLGETFLMNDCSAGALGEYVYGGWDVGDLVYVAIGSGIGAGMVEDGRVLLGSDGNFGEVGHMVIGDELKCGCGGTGHWEAYCSGENLPDMAEELVGASFSSAEELFESYIVGDEEAARVVDKMRSYNAIGIANLINIFDPELVILGGGVVLKNTDVVLEGMEEKIDEGCVQDNPKIDICSLGERATLYGLKAVCEDKELQKLLVTL